MLGGTGRVQKRLKIMLVGLAVNLALNLALIPHFGPQGSALAVGLSWIPIWFLSARATHIHASAFDWMYFLKNILALSIVGLIVYFVFPRDLSVGAWRFVASLGLACACFVGTFFVMNKDEILAILASRKPKITNS